MEKANFAPLQTRNYRINQHHVGEINTFLVVVCADFFYFFDQAADLNSQKILTSFGARVCLLSIQSVKI